MAAGQDGKFLSLFSRRSRKRRSRSEGRAAGGAAVKREEERGRPVVPSHVIPSFAEFILASQRLRVAEVLEWIHAKRISLVSKRK